jgi:hypothetical protein
MAIDTRDRRAAAIMAGIPFIVIAPLADGTIDAADRQHIAHVYPGIAAAGPVAPAVGETMYGMMRIIRMVRTILLPYDSMYIE